MKKKTAPKLGLRPDTIRALVDLTAVRGGDAIPGADARGDSNDFRCSTAAAQ